MNTEDLAKELETLAKSFGTEGASYLGIELHRAAAELRRLAEHVRVLREVIEDLLQLHRFATFDNGVTDSTGYAREGEHWARLSYDHACAALTATETDHG